ncbi:MAG: 4-hydroxythreonine-4-phosphate dehydrogenase PdxA [Acidobacteria bacterium]|nr:4-hydroxythreonine-4-phosphate dehydrogenase PdxA [Acidobacteriota bacterium]
MPESKNILPQIGITIGDPAGIGPEISLHAAQDPLFAGVCRMVLFGGWDLLRSCAGDLGLPFQLERVSIEDLAKRESLPDRCVVDIPAGDVLMGVGSKTSGESAGKNIVECASACSRGYIDAMVTAPINKKFFQEGGFPFPGHTEFLAHLSGASEIAMAFLTDRLKVVLTTIHVPLRVVAESLSPGQVYEKLRLILTQFPRFGLPCGKVAVAGLNPHAGESGIMGAEDIERIAPAVDRARMDFPESVIDGPLPADTLFWRAWNGEFDVVLAMYHDQGLAPIKLVGFGQAVNVTLGLPFIRTSVDHGTAYDIAGKGIARHDSMNSAIRWAMRLLNRGK